MSHCERFDMSQSQNEIGKRAVFRAGNFPNFVLAVLERSLADVEEELSKLRRLLKVCAFGYTEDQLPASVRRGTFMNSRFHKPLKLNNYSLLVYCESTANSLAFQLVV